MQIKPSRQNFSTTTNFPTPSLQLSHGEIVFTQPRDWLGHMVNLYNMIGMKLNSHPAANLVCAKRVIV